MGQPLVIKVADALSGKNRLGVDTSPFIYLVERFPRYIDVVRAVFKEVDGGSVQAYTSVITLTETLTVPIRDGDTKIEALYRSRLLFSRNLTSLAVVPAIADYAASLRARYRLRTPDALQIATALHARCDAFLTNDRGLSRVTELPVLLVDDLEL